MLRPNLNRIWTSPECLVCLTAIAFEILKRTTENINTQLIGMKKTYELLKSFSINDVPTDIANKMYRMLLQLTQTSDPFKEIKKQSNKLAQEAVQRIRSHVEEADSPYENLQRCLAASIAGNMIDFGTAGHSINLDLDFLESCYYQITTEGFAIDDASKLFIALKEASDILFIADNAGEIYFDLFLVNYIKRYNIKTTLVVKSGPISNDATLEDVSNPLFRTAVTRIMTTGTNALGVSITESSQEFLNRLRTTDVIIAKGQSNFETLFYHAKQLTSKPIFFLFRTKCRSIANFLGQPIGKNIILLRNAK